LAMTTGPSPSITATQELVVPRSIPTTRDTLRYSVLAAGAFATTTSAGRIRRSPER
jgi:hypothetical protein